MTYEVNQSHRCTIPREWVSRNSAGRAGGGVGFGRLYSRARVALSFNKARLGGVWSTNRRPPPSAYVPPSKVRVAHSSTANRVSPMFMSCRYPGIRLARGIRCVGHTWATGRHDSECIDTWADGMTETPGAAALRSASRRFRVASDTEFKAATRAVWRFLGISSRPCSIEPVGR